MINNSRLEYIFIRACIIALHYFTPLCILYTLLLIYLYGLKATRYPIPLAVEVVALAETLFYLLVFLPYRAYLQRAADHPDALSRPKRRALFEKCNANIPDADTYLQKWFLGAPPEEIKRDNIKEFILWAFFNRGGEPGADEEELEEYVCMYEDLLGRKFEEGRGKATCLRLTLEKVDMLHRSLAWYFCVGFVDFLTYLHLLLSGFHFHRTPLPRALALFPFRPQTLLTRHRSPAQYTTYWHRPHTSRTHLPILFIHGIGIGLYPYVPFLGALNASLPADESIGIIALEIHPISFRLTHAPLSSAAMCAEIAQILQSHGYDRVVLAAHSYGSVVATHLLSDAATSRVIADVVLIDPVSILLHLPDVAYNFTRRRPDSAAEHQLWYFASMDIGVAHTLARHFFWSENVLWKEDLGGRNVTVSLAGRDLIVNTEAVGRYLAKGSGDKEEVDEEEEEEEEEDTDLDVDAVLVGEAAERETLMKEEWKARTWTGKGIDILWFEDLDHAQVFDKVVTMEPLVHALRTYCRNGARETGDEITNHEA